VFTYIIVHGPRAQTSTAAPRQITLISRIAEQTGGISRLAETSQVHRTSISTVSHIIVYVPIVRTSHIVKVATISHMVKVSTISHIVKISIFTHTIEISHIVHISHTTGIPHIAGISHIVPKHSHVAALFIESIIAIKLISL